MKTKQEIYNAGPIKMAFRSLLGLLMLFIFYFLWLWATFELQAAVWGSLVMLLGGPFVFFPLLFLLRFLGSPQIPWKQNEKLCELYLSQILTDPGPRVRLWMDGHESQPCIFWIENPFHRTPRQEIFVSQAWMKLPERHRQETFLLIWKEISHSSRIQRSLRSFQIAYWVGLLWPLDLIFWVFKKAQIFLGLEDLPFLSFWIQRIANSFKRFLAFQKRESRDLIFKNSQVSPELGFRAPDVWSSLLWGPWYRNCSQYKHPFWYLWGFD